MWNYTDKVMEHFYHPRNMGTLPDANAVGQFGSIVCGDALKLSLKIQDNRIVDAKFQTFGCTSAIASSSVLTELIIGKTIEEALAITNQDIVDKLDGLPAEKMHCSVMGREALHSAIANYRGQKALEDHDDDSKLICRCFGISEKMIRRNVIENRLRTVEDVTNYTKAGGGCTSCHADIQDIIDDVWKKELADQKPAAPATNAASSTDNTSLSANFPKMTKFQKMMYIHQILEEEIKPTLAMDRGGIELVDVEDNVVKVKLHGACGSCASGTVTLKMFVERVLREKVFAELQVQEVR